MIIRSVEYAGSVATPDGPRPGVLPQVAFSGRSNVGKSSLINSILQRTRSKVAHVSGKPGKTRMLNYYRVNDSFFLVDLPGYGYAKVPGVMRDAWRELIEGYLTGDDELQGVVHLVDSRHDPTRADHEMVEFLAQHGLPTLIVLTKMDKLGRAARKQHVATAIEKLGLDEDQILPFSSKTGEGRDELLAALSDLLGLEKDK
jgi:GTP-binding protein